MITQRENAMRDGGLCALPFHTLLIQCLLYTVSCFREGGWEGWFVWNICSDVAVPCLPPLPFPPLLLLHAE